MSNPPNSPPPFPSNGNGNGSASGSSSSVLYTLLQDLGLTATAQALCEELQRQHAPTTTTAATAVNAELAAQPRATRAVADSPAHTPAPMDAFSLSATVAPQANEVDTVSEQQQQQQPSSLESTFNATVKLQSIVSAPTPTAVQAESAAPSPFAAAAHRMEEITKHPRPTPEPSLTSCVLSDGCVAAIAALANCAVEPLQTAAAKKPNTLALTSVTAIEAALRTMWEQETKSIHPESGAGVHEVRVASLLARAAWCELHITEVLFMQEYHLTHGSSSSAAAGSALLHAAQADLVDHALQLVAVLQELLTVTGPSASAAQKSTALHNSGGSSSVPEGALGLCLVAHLHTKALYWLRNAECVLAWLLRRHTNFDAASQSRGAAQSHPPPPHRKRRCLENPTSQDSGAPSSAAANSGGAPPNPLQTLQRAILSTATPTGFHSVSAAASYQQCLDALSAQHTAPSSNGTPLHAAVRLPTSVRLAMTAQRIKLLLTLMGVLTYNGERTIVCAVAKAAAVAAGADEKNGRRQVLPQSSGSPSAAGKPADVLRRWWTARCVLHGQLLQQAAHQLRTLFPAVPVTPPPTSTMAGVTSNMLRVGSAPGTAVHDLAALLDRQARQLFLSPNSLPTVSALSLQHPQNELLLCVSLLRLLEQEQEERVAWLDRYVLDFATAAASSAHLPTSLSTATVATQSSSANSTGNGSNGDAMHSPNIISPGSPGARSEASSVSSPVWTLPLPHLPPPSPSTDGTAAAQTARQLSPLEGPQPSSGFTASNAVVEHTETAVAATSALSVRAAARVLRWQPHFTHLLTTIATGRWQAPFDATPVAHPCSGYNRTRRNLALALTHAQELLRLQPRRLVAANGCEYVARPGVRGSAEATTTAPPPTPTPLSLVEQLPRAVQLFTLQGSRALQRAQQRLTAHNTKTDGSAATSSSSSRWSSNNNKNRGGAASSLQPHRRPGGRAVSPAAQPFGLQSPLTPPRKADGSRTTTSTPPSAPRSATSPSLTDAAPPTALRRIAAALHHALRNAPVVAAVVAAPASLPLPSDHEVSPGAAVSAAQDRSVVSSSVVGSTPSTSPGGVSPEIVPGRATWSPDSAAVGTAESLEPLPEHSSSIPSPPIPSSENEEEPTSSSSSSSASYHASATASVDAEALHDEESDGDDADEADEEEEGAAEEEESFEEEPAISVANPELDAEEEGEDEGLNTDEETDEEWPQSALETEEEEEEEEEEEGSEASSADMDFDRAEDAMKEEVECVEVTDDGRLMALLTARGRLTVLRLQSRDVPSCYEEEVVLDTLLPHVPQKRLQWYESLSSFVRLSPCRRFVLASVQFLAVHEKGQRVALARTQQDNAGEVCVFSLHCNDDERSGGGDCADELYANGDREGKKGLDSHSQRSRSRSQNANNNNNAAAFADRVQQLLHPLPERLYDCFRPHNAACLTARWVDPRWWGGGRRSRWANSATEPLNTMTAAAAAVVRGAEGRSRSPSSPAHRQSPPSASDLLPTAWRVAAAVLLSEYQCLSVGLDDRIVRWMPASGVVLQCILTEPVQDLVVSPLMASFYVMSDAGDLYMYDAWDERDMGELSSNHSSSGGDGRLSIWSNLRDVCEHEAHPLILPVTADGHPCYYRTGTATQPYGDTATATAAAHAPPRRSSLANEEAYNDNVEDANDTDVDVGLMRGGFEEEVHKTRHAVHYTGPVTPVFQRMIDPTEKRRRRTQIALGGCSVAAAARHDRAVVKDGHRAEDDDVRSAQRSRTTMEDALLRGGRSSGLPRSLRWLLPQRWTAHTPWDAQLGRRLIRHLLRRSSAPTAAREGQLCYERDDGVDDDDDAEEEDVDGGVERVDQAALRLRGSCPRRTQASSSSQPRPHNAEVDGEANASQSSSDFAADDDDVTAVEEEAAELWEYDYTTSAHVDDDGVRPPHLPHVSLNGTRNNNNSDDVASAAAAARDAPIAVRECAAHPTPARGTLRRAYYPSGACLVYRSVAQALCAAGDLADRQRNEEMGPGGLTHHLLAVAFSGEPQWTAVQRLWSHDEGSEGEDENHLTPAPHNDNCGNDEEAPNAASLPAPSTTPWSTAALARVILWKNRLSTLQALDHVPLDTWTAWEAAVLATSYHADAPRTKHAVSTAATAPDTSPASSSAATAAAQLLAARGFVRARDVWRRGAPAAQRSLAATARNGRFLCVTASVGPYRKLVNPREPLRDVKGFYACVVFDVYAGAVLRVIPVCPVDPSGLRGLHMLTSPQHDMDPKQPVYRLQCSVTVIPVIAAEQDAVGNNGDAEEEAAEPKEIVALTIGGLANTVYVFDAMNGRRIACSREVEHQCGLSAAAAYQACQATRVPAATVTAAAATASIDGKGLRTTHTRDALSPHSPVDFSPPFVSPSSLLPSTIRKPADVLASVATWGRATGFDGITDPSSSSTSTSSTASSMNFVDGLRARNGSNSNSSGANTRPSAASPTILHGAAAPAYPNAAGPPHQQQHHHHSDVSASRVDARVAAAHRAVQDAVTSAGVAVPRLLQGETSAAAVAASSSGSSGSATRASAEWDLRGVLASFHPRQPGDHPESVKGAVRNGHGGGGIVNSLADDGNSNSDVDVEVGDGADVWEWHFPQRGVEGEDGGRGNGVASSSTQKSGPARRRNGSASTHHNGSSAAPSHTSSLYAFYQTLLGGAPQTLKMDKDRSSSSTAVVSDQRGAAWRQQRRRLLERVLRHYDADLLWQAYVTLFSASSTAAVSVLPPASAVAALVKWAHATTMNAAAAAAVAAGSATSLGVHDTLPSPSWVWCASRRRSSNASLIVTGPDTRQPAAMETKGEEEDNKREELALQDSSPGGRQNTQRLQSDAQLNVPFARILLQREELMCEVQDLEEATQPSPPTSAVRSGGAQSSPPRSPSRSPATSLLAQMRTQAMLDGSLPPSTKLLHAQQRDVAAAASTTATAHKTFLPSHHQNQVRLDVVNAVATWMDANGGFYVCFGSEDGGLYLLGGNVDA